VHELTRWTVPRKAARLRGLVPQDRPAVGGGPYDDLERRRNPEAARPSAEERRSRRCEIRAIAVRRLDREQIFEPCRVGFVGRTSLGGTQVAPIPAGTDESYPYVTPRRSAKSLKSRATISKS
jgi:hypothetical protein